MNESIPEFENSMAEPKEDLTFESKKRRYFTQLGLELRDSFKLHRDAGLWDRNEEGIKDWRNVSEHCLVEAARAEVFSELFGFDSDLHEDLLSAAALHDFFKKGEKEIASAGGGSWGAFDEAGEAANQKLIAAGVDERVIDLVNSVGHTSLKKTQKLLNQEELDDSELAFLVMHYIDDYTADAKWADDPEVDSFEARMIKNESNPRYAALNESGKEHFNGLTTFQAMRDIGRKVETRLELEMMDRNGNQINPGGLPTYIDQQIRLKISLT